MHGLHGYSELYTVIYYNKNELTSTLNLDGEVELIGNSQHPCARTDAQIVVFIVFSAANTLLVTNSIHMVC